MIFIIEVLTAKNSRQWMKHLLEFRKVSIENAKGKNIKVKMNEKGNVVMMVGYTYATNHASATYWVYYNSKTNRIIFSRDMTQDNLKSKKLNGRLDVFSDNEENNITYKDDSSISSEEYNLISDDETTQS